jgi:hypothetical protein
MGAGATHPLRPPGRGIAIDRPGNHLAALRASLREQVAALRGVPPDALPPA